jgi:hypothetical protein
MPTIKERLENKPSKAVRAMVEGLRDIKTRDDFEIDMSSYGDSDEEGTICFGCAATVTLMRVTGVTFTPDTIGQDRVDRMIAMGMDPTDTFSYYELQAFEMAINNLRLGNVYVFLRGFLDSNTSRSLAEDITVPRLGDNYTIDQLANYEILANWLEARGF